MSVKKLIGTIGLALATLVSLLTVASPASASVTYYYAGGHQTGVTSAKGIAAKIWVANPYIQSNPSEHVIMELSAEDTSNGNSIEFGWVKEVGSGPRLFVYYWKGGVAGNCWYGCPGYNDNASNPIDVGADLTTVAAGCNGTTTLNCVKQFTFVYVVGSPCGPAPNGVFFYYDNVNIGCMQSTLIPGTSSFDYYQAFSEVAYTGATVPCDDGGNGKYATNVASASGPAYFGSISYTGTGAPTPSFTIDTPGSPGYFPAAYSAQAVTGSVGNRTFTVGGAGYTSTGGSPGNTGSC